jgi:hypothetical protein
MSDLLAATVVVPFILGAVVGWCGNWFYYRLSKHSAEKSEARTLLHLRTLLIAAEASGNVELARDAAGTVTGGRVIRAVPNSGEAGTQGHAPVVQIAAQSSTVAALGSVERGSDDPIRDEGKPQ